MVIFWDGLVPVGGAFVSRRSWRQFRYRFDELRLKPLLDYARYRDTQGGLYRFIGGFESITDGHTLWIRGETLTIPVALAGAHTYVLPMPEDEALPESFDPGEEVPEQIRWDRVSLLTEGARVFVGGALVRQDDRWIFVSTKEHPLLVIFYDGNDRSLTIRAIRAGRHKNEYWNSLTPYAIVAGAFSQIIMAISFLSRPAFRLTVITAFIALFIPLFPVIPPGVLCTVLYRRLWWQARIFRAYRDLARLPLIYMPKDRMSPGTWYCRLPDGEPYGAVSYAALPEAALEQQIPLLIPEKQGRKKQGWYIFGSIPEGTSVSAPAGALPQEPQDPFATFGAIPGNPEQLARGYTIKAYILEIISGLFLLAGIGINIFFIGIIVAVLL
ncbi:MAG: hypothetical protein LBT14_00645 [Treponema sp.]|jgi:hypothetical protein|nr:hypothetical protein [Treponema sp.]